MIPNNNIFKVSKVKKWSYCNFKPTAKPKKIVTMLINAFCIVSDNLSTTPHSLHKLPNVNIPTNGQASGKKIAQSIRTTRGNTIFSLFETSLNCVIWICLSSLVVNNFIIGG